MSSSIYGANLRAFDEKSGFLEYPKNDKSLLYKEIKFFQIFGKWSKILARFLRHREDRRQKTGGRRDKVAQINICLRCATESWAGVNF
jgi:hypothetical protein